MTATTAAAAAGAETGEFALAAHRLGGCIAVHVQQTCMMTLKNTVLAGGSDHPSWWL